MTKMSDFQKKSRKQWRERLTYYVECTKLPHDDEEYFHPSESIELIDDIPEFDLSKADRRKYLGMLGVEK